MKNVIFVTLICGFISACGGSYSYYKVVTKYPEGQELYVSKCGGCHRLHERNEFTMEKWNEIISLMQKKSKTSDKQIDKIFNFLTEKDSVQSGIDAKISSEN